MPDGLLERLRRKTGVPELLEVLEERLAPSELQSLLLEVYARAAARVSPRQVLEQYVRDRFVRPSLADPRRLNLLERLAWEALPPGYQPLELSPLAPLGTCAAVATVSQNKIVSTSRNTEVVSDATNVLALEAASRRKRRAHPVLLAASQRMTRAQGLPGPGSWAHFRLLTLVAAGRARGTLEFEAEQLLLQLTAYLRLLERLEGEGWGVCRPRVAFTEVTPGSTGDRLEQLLLAPLRAAAPQVRVELDPARKTGRGYHQTVCFKLFATDAQGTELELGDGGDVPWTQKLLSDAKERLVISGLGSERLAMATPPS